MKHIRRVNRGPSPEELSAAQEVQAQSLIDTGCSTLFEPGWETGSDVGFMSLCRPFYRDLQGCAGDCWWPAQVPDDMSTFPGWLESCAAIDKDWADIEFVK